MSRRPYPLPKPNPPSQEQREAAWQAVIAATKSQDAVRILGQTEWTECLKPYAAAHGLSRYGTHGYFDDWAGLVARATVQLRSIGQDPETFLTAILAAQEAAKIRAAEDARKTAEYEAERQAEAERYAAYQQRCHEIGLDALIEASHPLAAEFSAARDEYTALAAEVSLRGRYWDPNSWTEVPESEDGYRAAGTIRGAWLFNAGQVPAELLAASDAAKARLEIAEAALRANNAHCEEIRKRASAG